MGIPSTKHHNTHRCLLKIKSMNNRMISIRSSEPPVADELDSLVVYLLMIDSISGSLLEASAREIASVPLSKWIPFA